MPRMFNAENQVHRGQFVFRFFRSVATVFVFLCQLGTVVIADQAPQQFTNLVDIVEKARTTYHFYGNVHLLATVCAASPANTGIVVAQDATATEVLDLGPQTQDFVPGEQIFIDQTNCLLRKRNFGVEITAAPLVDNDGVHKMSQAEGDIYLTAGRYPITVEWFNALKDFGLVISNSEPEGQMLPLSADHLSHDVNDFSHPLPGLAVQCYEGTWDNLPDFNLLIPVKSGVVSNFNLGFRTRDERVGLQFKGFFDAPRSGKYVFQLSSDDGSILTFGRTSVTVKKVGTTAVPAPVNAFLGEPFHSGPSEWKTVAGRVKSVTTTGKELELGLRSGYAAVTVHVVDAVGLNAASLLGSFVRVNGVGRGALNVEGQLVLGDLSTSDRRQIILLDSAPATPGENQPLTTALQVQELEPEEAQRHFPVKIRGVITSAPARYDNGLTLQDGTRGIYVSLERIPYWIAPAAGEFCEVEGVTGPGNFAPVVVADKVTVLGPGQMPEPAHPSWNQLVNGSMDVQWVEFQGLVTGIQSNSLAMQLMDGSLDAQMVGYDGSDLKRFKSCVISLCGTLFANWNAATHEVRVGQLRMENASISIEHPATKNIFTAVAKNIRDLRLFDAQIPEFQRVKIRGQIIYSGPEGIFLQQGDAGSQILMQPDGITNLEAGDLVEAIGYPTIISIHPILHDSTIEKLGHSTLPQPKIIGESDLKNTHLDATWVSLSGKLNGWHDEGKVLALEMAAGNQPFIARISDSEAIKSQLRVGSLLALTGVYLAQGGNQRSQDNEGFGLLLNSSAGISIISQPSWWTLPRLLVLVGTLLFVLLLSAIWITQLRLQVERRTVQLHQEIHQREQTEKERALEAERTRIARDLHDDLGSSLAEIAMLANAPSSSKDDNINLRGLLEAITNRARTLIGALDVIVWAVDPEENSLQSLADYFTGFVDEYLAKSGIVCRFDIPMQLPEIPLDGKLRHDLFLAVKEALHNIVRHSRATEVLFAMNLRDKNLEIELTDNGMGFESKGQRSGHGLKNLDDRLKKLGGICRIESKFNGGTTVKMNMPLP